MSGFRGKRKEEEYASEGDSEGHAPPKKKTSNFNSKKDSEDDSTDSIVVCEVLSLSMPIYVYISRVSYANVVFVCVFRYRGIGE